MIDIKFRIRNIDEKKFEDLRFITMIYDDKGIEVFTDDGDILENYELNQYTGEKDIKGNEIYVGDIFRYKYDADKISTGIIKLGKRKDYISNRLKEIGFYVDWDNCLLREDLGYWAEITDVQGNVYDNPELLGDDVNV